MSCCSCVFTSCATCSVILRVKYVLYFYISTFHSMCAVPSTFGGGGSDLISCFPSTLLMDCLNDFEMVPVTHIIIGITCAITFHVH